MPPLAAGNTSFAFPIPLNSSSRPARCAAPWLCRTKTKFVLCVRKCGSSQSKSIVKDERSADVRFAAGPIRLAKVVVREVSLGWDGE
jgi:hypothetical protein